MIIYSPLDGEVATTPIRSRPKCCFLMTRLGGSVPEGVAAIRRSVSDLCANDGYEVIDAGSRVTGRDFLLKIWKMIASTPLAVGVCHEEIPFSTQANIYLNPLQEQAEHYEMIPDQLERNPVLAIDYLKRAFLITGDEGLRRKARELLEHAGLDGRAKNSVEQLAAAF